MTEEPMQIIPVRSCGHHLIAELMTIVPDPATKTAKAYCIACYIDKINEIAKKAGVKPLEPCGLFDITKGPINPETGKPVGEWIYNY